MGRLFNEYGVAITPEGKRVAARRTANALDTWMASFKNSTILGVFGSQIHAEISADDGGPRLGIFPKHRRNFQTAYRLESLCKPFTRYDPSDLDLLLDERDLTEANQISERIFRKTGVLIFAHTKSSRLNEVRTVPVHEIINKLRAIR